MGGMQPTTSADDQQRAAALRAGGGRADGRAATGALDAFDAIDVQSGTHKYVLISARADMTGERKTLLRAGPGSYHVEVATPTVEALTRAGLACDIPGGGRIARDDGARTIAIYGYSYGFGKGDHALAADMCREAFPGYAVTWSDDGY